MVERPKEVTEPKGRVCTADPGQYTYPKGAVVLEVRWLDNASDAEQHDFTYEWRHDDVYLLDVQALRYGGSAREIRLEKTARAQRAGAATRERLTLPAEIHGRIMTEIRDTCADCA